MVDCTLGGGGHASAILDAISPGGTFIGLDIDPLELPAAEARLREAGRGSNVLVVRHGNFADLPAILASAGVETADIIFADLGVSSMQAESPARGFNFKGGPLDMRLDPTHGETAADLLARISEGDLTRLLIDHADEPFAPEIAAFLKAEPPGTGAALDRLVRRRLVAAHSTLSKPALKSSVRRTFQALRIAVNGELAALDRLLSQLPRCLTAGGRVAIVTFHSGEDRRVDASFRDGLRAGVYAQVAEAAVRSTKEETRANRRAAPAKLRWAVRAPTSDR